MSAFNETPATAAPARVVVGPWSRRAPRWRAWLAALWREAMETYALMAQWRRFGDWP
jgi:hypothetical protein